MKILLPNNILFSFLDLGLKGNCINTVSICYKIKMDFFHSTWVTTRKVPPSWWDLCNMYTDWWCKLTHTWSHLIQWLQCFGCHWNQWQLCMSMLYKLTNFTPVCHITRGSTLLLYTWWAALRVGVMTLTGMYYSHIIGHPLIWQLWIK